MSPEFGRLLTPLLRAAQAENSFSHSARESWKEAVRESLHTQVVFRAVRIKGGAAKLAQSLDVPVADVHAWMHSTDSLPERHFMKLLDIIAEETLRHLSQRSEAKGGPNDASA